MPDQAYEQHLDAALAQINQLIADFFTTYPPPDMTPTRIATEQQRIVNSAGIDWLREHLRRADQGHNPWQDVREVED